MKSVLGDYIQFSIRFHSSNRLRDVISFFESLGYHSHEKIAPKKTKYVELTIPELNHGDNEAVKKALIFVCSSDIGNSSHRITPQTLKKYKLVFSKSKSKLVCGKICKTCYAKYVSAAKIDDFGCKKQKK
ncbi:hypothetical protein FDP41_003379 [Naegleria fowleri]|uniref:Uncharacterized protein n=1 Tax=Naegleria fowleri TaxID=5763 RepID=A0A6A5BK34_NAEFO|nr:uncharacterized protein FDP41_003379 [Naegleria fowleri]KAF0977387.1 hypothetical protein FDP41_003379 [Naegleria fowleri]